MEQWIGSKLGKEYVKASYSHPGLFKFYTEYIIQNAGLDDSQAGIKISRKNINNLRYADDIILVAESEEELKNLLLRVKEESEKAGLKLNILKTKIMASGPMARKSGNSDRFYFLASKTTVNNDCSHEIKGHLFLGRKDVTNLNSVLKSRDKFYQQRFI